MPRFLHHLPPAALAAEEAAQAAAAAAAAAGAAAGAAAAVAAGIAVREGRPTTRDVAVQRDVPAQL